VYSAKKIFLAVFVITGFTGQSVIAKAGDWYVSVKGGFKSYPGETLVDLYGVYNIPIFPTHSYSSRISENANIINYKLKETMSGGFITPELGYMISDEFRGTLQFTYNSNQKKIFNNNKVPYSDELTLAPKQSLSSWDISAAFYYDFLKTPELLHTILSEFGVTEYDFSKFISFIGLKVGLTSRHYQTIDFSPVIFNSEIVSYYPKIFTYNIDTGTLDRNERTKRGIVLGATIGLAYKVTDKVSLELAYTIERQPKIETTLATRSKTQASIPLINGNYIAYTPVFKAPSTSHNLGIGIRFIF
jgi:hypothetical protein